MFQGKVGTIHSWVLHGDEPSKPNNGVRILEKLPLVVFVKFPGAKWKLPSLEEPGLYPIKPKSGTWFLDKGRKNPSLKITRRQLPLAPAFAVTAHTAQGQTKDSAIVDLQISKGTSPIASYVAMTRVEKKENVLIYRPFERNLFTGGPVEGPATLLKVWRGENIDWKALEEKHIPEREAQAAKL